MDYSFKLEEKFQLGKTGISIPPIIFGTSALGNLFGILPYSEKKAICEAWFTYVKGPIVIDSAGKYGAGLALEMIGKLLQQLGKTNKEVIISNKLGWKRKQLIGNEPTYELGIWFGLDHDAEQDISYEGIIKCWEQGCELLGDYTPDLVSVHDPDEYLSLAIDDRDGGKRFEHLLEAYDALFELKKKGAVKAVGVGAKDWQIIHHLSEHLPLDWVMLACSFTIYHHPPELLRFIEGLKDKGIGIINSAIFHSGFLVGGNYFDYRPLDPTADSNLFDWRELFFSICKRFHIPPAYACIEFGLSAPGIQSVSLNTSNANRIESNVAAIQSKAPKDFWQTLKEEKLISPSYPYVDH
jgi:D-threo-aldose 1-dehydrogenase